MQMPESGHSIFPYKYAAVVLAGGAGKRMNSSVHKQYLPLAGKPVLYYSLKTFEESPVDTVVLVTGEGEEEYCRTELVERYGFTKVNAIVRGGQERYHSVHEGLKAVGAADYVLIHDGARPLVDVSMIERSMTEVVMTGACIVGMPVKDTVKEVDGERFAVRTPERSKLWQIQTPQTFSYEMIARAYTELLKKEDKKITDDAMVLEAVTGKKAKVIEGSYRNMKITTPEDLLIAEAFLAQREIV